MVITISSRPVIDIGFAVQPRLDLDKVNDETRDGALKDNVIPKKDMFTVHLGLIILAHNWK